MRIMSLKQFVRQTREPRETHFLWSMAELKGDIGNWSDNYMVDITMNSEEPGTVWMKFVKNEDDSV
jgi:hypothetical protein